LSVCNLTLMQHYSSKTDDELPALEADPDSLLQEARPTVADELRRRNLDARPTPTAHESDCRCNFPAIPENFARSHALADWLELRA